MARVGKEPAKLIPMEETVGFALARACRAHRGAVGDALAVFGLHPWQDMVLLRLWRGDGLGQSELAERVGVEASTMSNMLMRLERARLVERRRSGVDERSSRAYLTQRGRALRGSVEDVWAAVEGRTFEGISREEGALRRSLERVREKLIEGERRRP